MADNIKVSVDELSKAVKETLENYNKVVVEGTKAESKKAMDELVAQTKATAPVGHRRRHYRSSITSKVEWENALGCGYLWYVKGSDYRLSHLLEHGHQTRNGGRAKAFHFIQNALNPIADSYLKAVEEVLKNG